MCDRLSPPAYHSVKNECMHVKMPGLSLASHNVNFDHAAIQCLWTQDWARLAKETASPHSSSHGAAREIDAETHAAELYDGRRILESEATSAPWLKCTKQRVSHAHDDDSSDLSDIDSTGSDIPVASESDLEKEENAAICASAVEEEAVRELERRKHHSKRRLIRHSIIDIDALENFAKKTIGAENAMITFGACKELLLHCVDKIDALVLDAIGVEMSTRRHRRKSGLLPRKIRMSSIFNAIALHGIGTRDNTDVLFKVAGKFDTMLKRDAVTTGRPAAESILPTVHDLSILRSLSIANN